MIVGGTLVGVAHVAVVVVGVVVVAAAVADSGCVVQLSFCLPECRTWYGAKILCSGRDGCLSCRPCRPPYKHT